MNSSLFYSLLQKKFPFQPTYKQDVFFQKIAIFLTEKENNTIFVLKGYAGTGKTTVISTIVNSLLDINKKYVLFFGFIRAYKGLDWLLEAMADERIQAAGIELIVAGEFYDDPQLYHQIIEQQHLESRVHLFTNFIPNDKVSLYFSAADLVVQPYKHATQSGITQIAYHFEKPMIVTNVGGLPALVPDNKVGLVAEPNAASIAEKIIQFFNKGEQHYLPYLVEEKKKYSWEQMAQNFIILHQQL